MHLHIDNQYLLVKKYQLMVALIAITLFSCSTPSIRDERQENHFAIIADARTGDLNAMHTLCYRYMYGMGTEQNYPDAYYWCKKAAEKGINSSQTLLAEIYYYGYIAGEPNFPAAYHYYRKAATKGHAHAQFMLFHMLWLGQGTEKNRETAMKWLVRSSDQGYEKAIEILKKMTTGKSI